MSARPKLTYVVTHPITARLLLHGQLRQMQAWGFDVSVISSPGPDLDTVAEREGVRTIAVPMEREPSPKADVVSLAKLTVTLARERPHIVNVSTPKAALLGSLAARATRVPVRIYLVRGLRLETATGRLRDVLTATEHITASCVHQVVCNSASLRASFLAERLAPPSKVTLVGQGSSNGVDAERFAPTAARRQRALELRAALGIGPDAFVVGFMGRLARDKGIDELVDAFGDLVHEHPDAHLLLVGDSQGGDRLAGELAAKVRAAPHTHLLGRVDDPEAYYAAMDVLAFPSHREGLPNAPLEAAAAGVPVAGFRATGTRDAVADGRTGTLVEVGDRAGLHEALRRYLREPALRERHGRAAQARVREVFARPAVWRAWAVAYTELLRRRGLPIPTAAACAFTE